MTMASVPTVTVEPEALAYADQVGMRVALDHMLEVTLRLVPGLRTVHVFLKPDWDYPERMNFIWDVRMERTTRDVYLATNREWVHELIRVTPQRPLKQDFFLKLVDDVV